MRATVTVNSSYVADDFLSEVARWAPSIVSTNTGGRNARFLALEKLKAQEDAEYYVDAITWTAYFDSHWQTQEEVLKIPLPIKEVTIRNGSGFTDAVGESVCKVNTKSGLITWHPNPEPYLPIRIQGKVGWRHIDAVQNAPNDKVEEIIRYLATAFNKFSEEVAIRGIGSV